MRQRQRRPKLQKLDPHTAEIAIVGSGLSGLATAVQLQRQYGFRHVSIYERDASLFTRQEGYGLTLTYNPAGILHTLGILNDLADAECPSRSHYLLDSSGYIRGYFGNAFSETSGWGQRGNLRVPRQRVRQILMSKLVVDDGGKDVIHWNYKLVNMQEVTDGVQLQFENGRVVKADLVIAADGIRSAVVQTWLPAVPPPQSLGVRVILGLTEPNGDTNENYHELLQERGFYTLAKQHRLFVMPYTGSALGRSCNVNEPVRFMWQLSFAANERDDGSTTALTSEQLQEEALSRTQNWHAPVQQLILLTPVSSIWGTMLRDRDPIVLAKHLQHEHPHCPRVILAGDALHAMSPFKGQGANQCLQDGAAIAKWLSKASIPAAVTSVMHEMVQRTAPVVAASREAARYWHSPAAGSACHLFAGINHADDVQRLVVELQQCNINAGRTQHLDERVRCVIAKLRHNIKSETVDRNVKAEKVNQSTEDFINDTFAMQAMEAASQGATGTLRKLSWEHPNWIRLVYCRGKQKNNGFGTTCLHAAAIQGHTATVHWLVTEAGCDMSAYDEKGQTAWDVAERHSTVRDLLNRLQASLKESMFYREQQLSLPSKILSS